MYTEAQSFTKNPKLLAWDFLVYGYILYHPVKYSKYILPLLSCTGISGWWLRWIYSQLSPYMQIIPHSIVIYYLAFRKGQYANP